MTVDTTVINPARLLKKVLMDYDENRARSKQTELGPSVLGSCERQVYHKIIGTPKLNETEKLRAILGTFIHEGIEKAMRANTSENPFGDDFDLESEMSYQGMPGHADFYRHSWAIMVDWKTTTKKSLQYFPSQGNIWQAQVYGLMKKQSGVDVKYVAVVVIPVDGKMDDIAQYVAEYDEKVALEGLAWLDRVKANAESGGKPPAPEKNAKVWCQFYCEFYDPTAEVGCPGKAGRE